MLRFALSCRGTIYSLENGPSGVNFSSKNCANIFVVKGSRKAAASRAGNRHRGISKELRLFQCFGMQMASKPTMKYLTKEQQKVLCVVLILLLTGLAVKTWRTAHPAPFNTAAQPALPEDSSPIEPAVR
jgi:hypothetical protein